MKNLLLLIIAFSFITAQEMLMHGYVYSSIPTNGEINPVSNAQVAIGLDSVPEGTLTFSNENGYYELIFDWNWDGPIPIVCEAVNYEFFIATLMPNTTQVEFDIQLTLINFNEECEEPNPAGCSQTGCPEGYECGYDPNDCTASSCYCNAAYGYDFWGCTEDCGGGTCIPMQTLGDLNNDSEVNVLDIILLVSFILITDIPTEAEFYAGDVNADEQLNVLDVVAIVNIILNPMSEACYLEPDPGTGCLAAIPMYYFNSQSQQCDMFLWGGCDGVIPFESLEGCQNTCE